MSSKRKILLSLFLFFLISAFEKETNLSERPPSISLTPFLEQKVILQENSNLSFLNSSFLKADLPPIQIFSQSLATLQESKKEILEYEVQPQDTISSISKKFGISEKTILWANNLTEGSKLKAGQKLIILPVDGVLHQVKKGETISEIAKEYKADLSDIFSFNELSTNEKGEVLIFPGDILVIPGGEISSSRSFSQQFLQVPNTFFICPLPPCNITQGLHWYNAVDFSNGRCGEYILAAASGKVILTKYGWNGGAGNTIKILHQNGVITQYGHLREILVKVGQEVYQGQIIGTLGNTGRVVGATGCHLHFSVLGAKNPFAKY
jgi:murein DD-endopeptidase MepM/ murein hydrolase activator NlpD